MSAGLDALRQGFDARVDTFATQDDGETDNLKLVRTGQTFAGIVLPAPEILVQAVLGADVREASTVQSAREVVPAIVQEDQLLDMATGDTWRVVRREDNPSDFAIKFWVVKIVQGTDDA